MADQRVVYSDAVESSTALAPGSPTPTSPRPIPRSVWVCALLSAAARFAPLPFLDDLIIGRIQRHLVATALVRHGRSLDRHQVAPLYEDPQGCVAGCLALAIQLPLAILLFPIRKIWGIVKAIRSFSKDVADTLLLARCIDHSLERPLMVDGAPKERLLFEAAAVRRAHFEAIAGTDLELLKSTLQGVFRRTGAPRLAQRLLRKVRRQDREVESPEALLESDPDLKSGLEELDAAMKSDELRALFQAFDQRFEAALQRQLAMPSR
ncbi:MAG: hypothetical protein H6718_01470 [Polyangiaceae bacterium]|nr:hypothetical protein [Polyangiaceae bacterium]